MADEIYWDPYDAAIAQDPYPMFTRMREEQPLYYNEKHDFYALTRFTDCEKGLTDWKRFSSRRGDILEIIQSGIDVPPGTLIMDDPPFHDVLRRMHASVFTPRRVMQLEPQVRAFCTGLLDPLVGTDRFDLIEALANEMPMRVIGMLLGIPEAGQVSVRERGDRTLKIRDGEKMKFTGAAGMTHEGFVEYLDWREKNPSDDFMTALLHAEFEDPTADGERRKLRRDEVLLFLSVLAVAGNETTGRLIGWMGAVLAKHPDQRAALVAEPSLIPNTVEETLRFEPTGHAVARLAVEDVEYYGQTVPAGSAVTFIVGAANRDPRRFEDPDSFDVRRKIPQQLTFGLGAHYCLGAALARLEGRIALEELLARFPEWEVDWDGAELIQTSTVRGYEKLPLLV
jgi:cytochrome P450